MRSRVLAAALIVAAVLTGKGDACEGTSTPVCNRSIWVSVPVEKSIVTGPGDLDVTVNFTPYVTWNTAAGCPQPISARADVRLECTLPTGPPLMITAPSRSLPTPAAPGLQLGIAPSVLRILSGAVHDTVVLECNIVVTYHVTFDGTGQGSGAISADGLGKVCLVPPSPIAADVPRLGLSRITPDGAEVQRCLKGDQVATYFLLSNNDPVESVTVDLVSVGTQLAVLPNGFAPDDLQFAYEAGVSAPSNPASGTDVFNAAFAADVQPGELLPDTDPTAVDPILIEQLGVVLRPLECRIICILNRSHGMCADGSCSQRLLRAVGTFEGGDPALGCANSVIVVDSAAATKRPLCRFKVTNKVQEFTFAEFTVDSFYDAVADVSIDGTHTRGNLGPEGGQIGPFFATTLLAGAAIPTVGPAFPDQVMDTVGFTHGNFNIDYLLFAQPSEGVPEGGGIPVIPGAALNDVRITGLDQLGAGGAELPFFGPVFGVGTAILEIEYDVGTDALTIAELGFGIDPPSYNGTLTEFLAGQAEPVFLADPATSKKIEKIQSPDDGFVLGLPDRDFFFLGKKDLPEWRHADVTVLKGPDAPLVGASWNATADTIVTRLEPGSEAGSAGEQIPIEIVALSLTGVEPIDVGVGWVSVTSPDGVNTAQVPFAVRQSPKKGRLKPKTGGEGSVKKAFKKIAPDQSAQGVFLLRNRGKGPVTVEVPDFPVGSVFSFPDAESVVGTHVLPPKFDVPIRVRYAPTGVAGKNKGSDTFKLEVARSDSAKPKKVKIKGTWKRP